MPVRPRRRRCRRIEWSPRIALALTIGPRPTMGDPGLDDATLEAAWNAYGLVLLDDATLRRAPWGFWRFDPAVPQQLRATWPQLYRVEHAGFVKREREVLEQRRAAWLAEHNGASGATRAPGGA